VCSREFEFANLFKRIVKFQNLPRTNIKFHNFKQNKHTRKCDTVAAREQVFIAPQKIEVIKTSLDIAYLNVIYFSNERDLSTC
jgi:hypothetical protein